MNAPSLNLEKISSAFADIFSLRNLTSWLSNIFLKKAFAEGTTDTRNYGNIQFGYSSEEMSLMQQDSYASPAENEYQLIKSGKQDEIEQKYNHCFTDSIGTLIGDDAEKGTRQITRNTDTGSVEDSSNLDTCAPNILGPHNPTYGDLVFRWRLTKYYQTVNDTLLEIQDPTENNVSIDSMATIPNGTPQELAKKILDNPNISFQIPSERTAMENIAKTGKATECGAPTMPSSTLGIILAAAQKYKIVVGVLVDGHGCTDQYHPKGLAVDLNGVSTIDGSVSTGRFITPDNYASSSEQNKLLRQFYGDMGKLVAQAGGGALGQKPCFGSTPPPTVGGVNYYPDSCDHLHVQVNK